MGEISAPPLSDKSGLKRDYDKYGYIYLVMNTVVPIDALYINLIRSYLITQ